MKKNVKIFYLIIILLFSSLNINAEEYPKPDGFINDFANVMQLDDKQELNKYIYLLKQKTGAEIAIATIPSIGDETVEQYAVKLFEKWRIGEKGKDNGVLILLTVKERRIKIEVGYGLEGVITDGKAGEILDTMVIPYFKKNNFSKGLFSGSLEIVRLVAKEYNVDLNIKEQKNIKQDKPESNFVLDLLILIFILFFIFRGRGRRGGFLFFPGPFIGGGFRSGGYSGGNFGGGGFGGFGGFGGGFSGGGGASRGF